MVTPTQLHITSSTPVVLKTPVVRLDTLLAASRLEIGQILNAVVKQQLSNSSFLISIGQTQVSAETKLPLKPGNELQLKVVQTGEQPLLKVLNPNLQEQRQLIGKEALRQILPKQQPIAEFFSNLKLPSPPSPQSQTQLSQQALQTLQTLSSGVATRTELLTPDGVKKLLQNSGLFLESRLTTQKVQQTEGDFKGNLLRLLGILNKPDNPAQSLNRENSARQIPQPANQENAARQFAQSGNSEKATANNALQTSPSFKQAPQTQANNALASHPSLVSLFSGEKEISKLRQQVESAIARVHLNQLNSIPTNEQEPQVWLFELPIQDKEKTDVFSLKITEQDKEQNQSDDKKNWSISLSFNLEGLGKVHTRILLSDDTTSPRLRANLWAEEDHTFDLITTHMDQLRQRLQDVEFIEPQIIGYRGKPNDDQENLRLEHHNELIDIEV